LLHAHTHRSILGAAGHIILTPANQLMVMGLKIWSLSNPGFEPATFRTLKAEREDEYVSDRVKQGVRERRSCTTEASVLFPAVSQDFHNLVSAEDHESVMSVSIYR
jgi:hypothetical protein